MIMSYLFDNLFFLALLLGGVVMFGISVAAILWSIQSKSWPTVDAKIISSRVVVGRRYTTVYWPIIRYTYEVNGKQYTSSFVTFASKRHLNRESAMQVVNQYREGNIVKAHYSSLVPRLSVLEPGISTEQAVGLGTVGTLALIWIVVVSYAFISWPPS